tara:strand:+ start:340 stop:951 length:612 start_codon:yes stop_codon:yes gene_type:complete
MHEIKMIYNLNDWPEGHVGHLVPSEEVINAFKNINKTLPMKNVLEFGFNTGWSTFIILKTLEQTTITSIEIYKFNNAEIAAQRLKEIFPDRTNIIWGDSGEVYKKVVSNEIILPNNKYDTAFIDGGHFPEIVEKDIELCKFLGIKNFIFDDGDCPNIIPAIKKIKNLNLIKKYPYINIRKLNNKYFLKESKGWEVGLHHYILD